MVRAEAHPRKVQVNSRRHEQKKSVTKPSFAAVPTYPLNINDMLALEKVAFVQFDRQGIQSRIDLGHSSLGSEQSLLSAQKQRMSSRSGRRSTGRLGGGTLGGQRAA